MKKVREMVRSYCNRKGLAVASGLAVMSAAPAFAVGDFTITAPTFDWTIAAGVAAAMLLLAVGVKGYTLVKSLIAARRAC